MKLLLTVTCLALAATYGIKLLDEHVHKVVVSTLQQITAPPTPQELNEACQ